MAFGLGSLWLKPRPLGLFEPRGLPRGLGLAFDKEPFGRPGLLALPGGLPGLRPLTGGLPGLRFSGGRPGLRLIYDGLPGLRLRGGRPGFLPCGDRRFNVL